FAGPPIRFRGFLCAVLCPAFTLALGERLAAGRAHSVFLTRGFRRLACLCGGVELLLMLPVHLFGDLARVRVCRLGSRLARAAAWRHEEAGALGAHDRAKLAVEVGKGAEDVADHDARSELRERLLIECRRLFHCQTLSERPGRSTRAGPILPQNHMPCKILQNLSGLRFLRRRADLPQELPISRSAVPFGSGLPPT